MIGGMRNEGMRTDKRYGIGIDVGGTKMRAALGTDDGTILDERVMPTPKGRSAFLEALRTLIAGWSGDAIGIGLPGQVTQSVVRWVPNLPELNGYPLADFLQAELGVPVLLQNDGKLSLIGEQWLGAAKDCGNVMMMAIGTGIGGGIMVDGRLLEGAHGTAGSLGWLTLDMDDEGDSEHGWLERSVSGTAIHRRAERLPSGGDGYALFENARLGDPEATGLTREIGLCIGTSIANVASILDLELAVIAGGLSKQLDVLLPPIWEAIERYASPSARQISIVPALLLERAGVIGALRLSFANSLL